MTAWRSGAVLLLAATALGACTRHAPATPFPALPALERPVAKASASKDSNIFVPAHAITERGGIPGVFVLSEGQARFRMIKPGRRSGGQVEVLAGLTGEEALVLGDLTEVHDGSPISSAEAEHGRRKT